MLFQNVSIAGLAHIDAPHTLTSKAINEQLQPVILVNQCQLNTSLAKEAMDVLPQFGIPVLKTCLHHRTAYRQSAVFGGTVHDLGPRAAQAIAEVDALADEIGKLLKAKPQPVSSVS